MRDKLGRSIEYLRVSVTQNCNMKCIYCAPDANHSLCDTGCVSALSPSEFHTIVKVMAEFGVHKVRITGGEPLTRPDVCDIIGEISTIDGIDDISMTTNGIHLNKMASELKEAGLKRLNISLDSLKEGRFRNITGCGNLDLVLKGVEKSLQIGLTPVKINTVLIKGINDDEIDDFIKLTKDMPLEVRFIELMPIGKFGEQNLGNVVLNSEIIASYPDLIPCEVTDSSQPAKYYRKPGFKGKVGFISPMSHKFCSCCNRIRLTCDGKIKPCLGDNGEMDILSILRTNPDQLKKVIWDAIYYKPEGHHFDTQFNSMRNMNAIGG